MIKFRAWDKFKEIMYVVEAIDFIENQISVRDEDFPECFKTLPLDNSVVLMQSTGLFDKNGKGIFEGDIIDLGTRIPFLNKIQKDKETGYLKLVPVDKRWTESYFTSFEDKSRYEILGNIHEHRHLLEE